MRILMTTTNSSLMDGINRHILSIAPSLNAMPDVEVAVCTTFRVGELNKSLEQQGVRCFALNAESGHSFCVLANFLHVMREFKPNLLHIHVLPLFARVIIHFFYQKVSCVQTVHGIVRERGLSKILNWLIDHILAINLKMTTFISNGVRRFYENGGGNYSNENSCVVYNPMDLCEQDCSKETLHNLLKLPQNTILLGTACRIASIKNPVLFTKVFCHVLKKMPSAHAVIIGDGEKYLLDEMKEVVLQFEMTDRVHFLGYCPNAKELIAGLDCFVMTSRSEGMPTALLEAMANGVLVAFMRGDGGLQDLDELNLKDGPFACIEDAGDDAALAHSIVKTLENQKLREGYIQNASRILTAKFSRKATSNILAEAYRKVLEQ